jgi:hypothetical protein
MIKLIGYAPDADSTTPGVLVNCNAFIPSLRGMEAAPSPVSGTNTNALAAACVGAAVVVKLDNTNRFLAGTATAIYEDSAGAWVNLTRAVGGAYTNGADNRWRFTQFGNVTLATNKSDTMQYSSSGAFANIAGGIKAAMVETVGSYIIACDTNDGTYGDSPNRWWVTPDYAGWTPSIANRIATGILTSSPGPIRAVKRFGDSAVIYKERSMFICTFPGAPLIFEPREIVGDIGAVSQEAVVSVGTPEHPMHIFMGYDGFYSFDGSRPIPIGLELRETVFNTLYRPYYYKAQSLHDRAKSRVYFFYPSTSGNGSLDKCVVYNYKTQRWGRDDRTLEAAVEYISSGVTYDSYGTYFSTYDTSAAISYDSPFFTSGSFSPAIINASHIFKTLSGTPDSGYITLGDVGDEINMSLVRRLQPRFLRKPTSATMTNYYRAELGDSITTDTTVNISNGRFDILREARWHRFQINTVGDAEISDVRIDIKPSGTE